MNAKHPVLRLALVAALLVPAPPRAAAADRREKIAVMKVDAPDLSRADVASLRDGLEAGVSRAVGSRLQVMTRDSAAASVGGGEKLVACMESASCDAEIGGALGVDYFVSASARRTARGVELSVTVLRTGRDVSLLRKDVKVFATIGDLLDGTAAHAELVTRGALGGAPSLRPAGPSAGSFSERGTDLVFAEAEEAVVSFESEPPGAVVQVDGRLVCKESPCRKRLPVGAHEVVFQRERYTPSVQRFTAAKGASVKGVLAPTFGWITVETTPPGVAIAVDGVEAGRSPIASREVEEGPVEVAVSDRCWLRAGERSAVRAGERKTIRLTAEPRLAGLRVDAEDRKGNAVEGDVRIDGAVAGPVGRTLRVPVCSRRASVTIGDETAEANLSLEEGKVATVALRPPERVAPRPAPASYAGGRLPDVTLRAKPGTVTLSHSKHASLTCVSCHRDRSSGPIEGLNRTASKDKAHALCFPCHKELRRGPQRCTDCHKKQ